MDLSEARVLLLEAQSYLMATYPPGLRQATFDLLAKKGVEIMLLARLADYDGSTLTFSDGRQVRTCTVIWTAGVRAGDLASSLGLEQASSGRLVVEDTLQLRDHPEVFVLGDAAYQVDGAGVPLPMLATVAQQEARVTAANIVRLLEGRKLAPFRYRDPGLLATIGRNAAVARIAGLSFSGYPAWVIWVFLHIYRLIGFRNRLFVLINWAWDYVFYDNQVRLITRE
jgi:NADH dehydrogenase